PDHIFSLSLHDALPICDQALAMLADPTDEERAILGAIAYQKNDVVLHTDASVLPSSRLAWAAWNYMMPEHSTRPVSVTYNMNILDRKSTRLNSSHVKIS